MSQTGKLEQLGGEAQKKAVKMSVEGLSPQAIADALNKEFNSDLDSVAVASFLSRSKRDSMMLIKEDKKFQQKLTEEYFDTVNQIKTINAELWTFFYELRDNPEYKDKTITCTKCHHSMILNIKSYGLLLKTADTILKQIQHVDTVLGKLQKKSFNVTYNYTDLSKKIAIAMPTLLHEMEKKGIVKVNKKRLKLYQGGQKMSYKEDEFSDDMPDEEDYDEDESKEKEEIEIEA